MSKKKRIIIHFSGIVQGVGFRYTTLQVSRKFPVTGTVKNLQDGRVELVAEGNQDALTAFRSKIEKAMDGYISKTEEKWTEATGHFSNFSISY